MHEKEMERITRRMTELAGLIADTEKRLPAHSVKPPVMKDLLAYEDEYDRLLDKMNELKKGIS